MTQPSRIDGLPDLPKPITNMLVGDDWQDVFDTDQMDAHYLKGYEAGSAAAAQAVPEGFVLVPREPTFEMNKAGQEAVWDFHPDDTIEGNEETARAAYFAMLDAAPTQGAEGAAPQATDGAFAALRALTEAVLTRADNDYLRRQLDAAVKVMAARGCESPVPWPDTDFGVANWGAPQAVVGEAKPQPRWYTGEQES